MGFGIKRVFVLAGLALALGGTVAMAQQVPNARKAGRQLYRVGRNMTEVRIVRPDLIPDALKPAIKSAASVQKYYEAFAVSPSEGLQADSAFQAINFHTAAEAGAAAVAGCNAKKKKESEACVVVAEFLPKKYDGPRAFSLSANATVAFGKKYRYKGRKKAFAISPQTGNWGQAVRAATLAEARAKALADCAAKALAAGGSDCRVVSEN